MTKSPIIIIQDIDVPDFIITDSSLPIFNDKIQSEIIIHSYWDKIQKDPPQQTSLSQSSSSKIVVSHPHVVIPDVRNIESNPKTCQSIYCLPHSVYFPLPFLLDTDTLIQKSGPKTSNLNCFLSPLYCSECVIGLLININVQRSVIRKRKEKLLRQ